MTGPTVEERVPLPKEDHVVEERNNGSSGNSSESLHSIDAEKAAITGPPAAAPLQPQPFETAIAIDNVVGDSEKLSWFRRKKNSKKEKEKEKKGIKGKKGKKGAAIEKGSEDPFEHLPEHEATVLRQQVHVDEISVGYVGLFKYADLRDKLVLLLSLICCIVAGAAMPLMTVRAKYSR